MKRAPDLVDTWALLGASVYANACSATVAANGSFHLSIGFPRGGLKFPPISRMISSHHDL